MSSTRMELHAATTPVPQFRFGSRKSVAGVLFAVLCALLALAALLSLPASLQAQGVLGTAQHVGVLGASTITNTGSTTIKGDLDIYPGSAVTGMGGITLVGAFHQTDGVANQALQDAASAYTTLRALPFTTDLTGQGLGGMTIAHARRLPLLVHRTADGPALPELPRPGQLPVRVPDREYSHHGERRLGIGAQWSIGRRRVLDNRNVRNARDRHGVPRQPHRGSEHHDDHRFQHRLGGGR